MLFFRRRQEAAVAPKTEQSSTLLPAIGANRLCWLSKAFLPIAFAAITALFYADAYNSGFGFDALEYLLIGRSLLHRYPLYAFIPSKSWAIYAVVAAAFRLGLPPTHAAVSALVCAVFATVLISTFLVARRLYGAATALLAAALVVACSFFMEANFLETEPFVLLLGLWAFSVVVGRGGASREQRRHPTRAFLLAGILIGAAFAFKSTAGFFAVAFGVWRVLRSKDFRREVPLIAAFAGGLAIAIIPPALYFVFTGRGPAYVFWTVQFPLFIYPRNTTYLAKMFTKLLWFWALLAFAAVVASRPRIWRSVRNDSTMQLASLLGLFSLAALVKTQSPHYLYPGAGFLCLWLARILQLWWSNLQRRRVWASAIAATCAGALAASIYLYSYRPIVGPNINFAPHVLSRFTGWQSYGAEGQLQLAVQGRVAPGLRVLALNSGSLLYFLADRYPNVPFVNTAEQTTWWIDGHKNELVQALGDPNLALVEFDARTWDPNDSSPDARQKWDPVLRLLEHSIARGFCRVTPEAAPGVVLWVRKGSSECAGGLPEVNVGLE